MKLLSQSMVPKPKLFFSVRVKMMDEASTSITGFLQACDVRSQK